MVLVTSTAVSGGGAIFANPWAILEQSSPTNPGAILTYPGAILGQSSLTLGAILGQSLLTLGAILTYPGGNPHLHFGQSSLTA